MGATVTDKPAPPTNGSPTVAEEPKKKGGRGGARKSAPDGHKSVKFHLKDEEHAQLTKLAENDDRPADDYARVIIRKHLRQNNEA